MSNLSTVFGDCIVRTTLTRGGPKDRRMRGTCSPQEKKFALLDKILMAFSPGIVFLSDPVPSRRNIPGTALVGVRKAADFHNRTYFFFMVQHNNTREAALKLGNCFNFQVLPIFF